MLQSIARALGIRQCMYIVKIHRKKNINTPNYWEIEVKSSNWNYFWPVVHGVCAMFIIKYLKIICETVKLWIKSILNGRNIQINENKSSEANGAKRTKKPDTHDVMRPSSFVHFFIGAFPFLSLSPSPSSSSSRFPFANRSNFIVSNEPCKYNCQIFLSKITKVEA